MSKYGHIPWDGSQHLALKEADPGFEPARPVVPARVRLPRDVEAGELISDARTAAVSDLFNGCYEALLELLLRFFIHEDESVAELNALADAAVNAMFVVIAPLGRLLTALPVGPSLPGKTAGPTFEIFRRSYILPHREAARAVLHERLLELADGADGAAALFAGADPAPTATARATLTEAARQLRALAGPFARAERP